MIKKINSLLIAFLLILNSCSTNPRSVSGEDAQKYLPTSVGKVIDVQPVTIKGKNSEIAGAALALLGGLAGDAVSGGDDKFRKIIIATGAIVGGVIGYYAPVKIGEHNGFQYVVSIEGEKDPLAIIQGTDKKNDQGFSIGSKVIIVHGEKSVRLLPLK
jgi:outer membrane lipoprotein SlyB|tara:strand:- start:49 stop:522 length:474 start_codon:yes stop_codon:yes gene_type:complete